jgi:drug/metabolite transporter (DMT)-like permease
MLFLGERLTWNKAAGAALIAACSVLIAIK